MVRTLTVHKSTICDRSRLSLSLFLSLSLSLSLSLFLSLFLSRSLSLSLFLPLPSLPSSFVRFDFKNLDNDDRFG